MRLDHIIVPFLEGSIPSVPQRDAVPDGIPGGHGGVETHVPIPNTTVKHSIADGTGSRIRESRSLPGFFCPFGKIFFPCNSFEATDVAFFIEILDFLLSFDRTYKHGL